MKCYIQILFLLTIIAVYRIDKVKCKPRKHFREHIHIEKTRLPIKHVSFVLEKVTPFGRYAFKHVINKRQAELTEVPLVPKEIPVVEGTLDDITEKKAVLGSNLDPTVIITSIVQPEKDDKSLPLPIPIGSPLLITPPEKPNEIVEVSEVIPEPKQELVPPNVEIVVPAEPTEILPPAEKPAEPSVLINAVVDNSVRPLVRIPIYRSPTFVSPVTGNIGKTLLYTDITQLPLTVESFPAPVIVPVPEVILPPPPPPPPPPVPPPPPPPLPVPPPPVIKEDPPPVKQETPNFFVKGSRLVLYVGSMMLQMLSRFVDGGFNFNQIPVPIIPGVQ